MGTNRNRRNEDNNECCKCCIGFAFGLIFIFVVIIGAAFLATFKPWELLSKINEKRTEYIDFESYRFTKTWDGNMYSFSACKRVTHRGNCLDVTNNEMIHKLSNGSELKNNFFAIVENVTKEDKGNQIGFKWEFINEADKFTFSLEPLWSYYDSSLANRHSFSIPQNQNCSALSFESGHQKTFIVPCPPPYSDHDKFYFDFVSFMNPDSIGDWRYRKDKRNKFWKLVAEAIEKKKKEYPMHKVIVSTPNDPNGAKWFHLIIRDQYWFFATNGSINISQ